MIRIATSNIISKNNVWLSAKKLIHSTNIYWVCAVSMEIQQCTKVLGTFGTYISLKGSNNKETTKYTSAIKKNKESEGVVREVIWLDP